MVRARLRLRLSVKVSMSVRVRVLDLRVYLPYGQREGKCGDACGGGECE